MKIKKIKKWMIVLVIAGCMALLLLYKPEATVESSTLLEQIDSYAGYTRGISKEEYEFYKYFVERDLTEPTDEESIDRLVKEYAGKVNAVFYLGNRLGFCEPYSFEVLKLRMEQENEERKLKLEQGEVVYGLEEFSLEIYFQYEMDNLKASLQGYLEEAADEEIMKMAEKYYTEHEEEFVYRAEIVYEQTLNDITETITADVDKLSLLGKTDTELSDFLQMSEIGEVYEDETEFGKRRVVLMEIVYNEKGYEQNAQMALYRYVQDELYSLVIEKVAKNNPVEFETN